LRAQRILNPGRIPAIAQYITGHPKSYILGSLIASIDRAVEFERVQGRTGTLTAGFLKIPLSARLLLHDGLHRRAAIEEALKSRPTLGQETVPLVLFVDPGFRRAEQMFTDLKRNETHSARSQSILYDHRDEMARLVKAVVNRVPVFAELTEMLRSKISNRALKLFTLSAIYHATCTLLVDQRQAPFSTRLTLATEFWSEVSKNIPDWRRAMAGEVSPAELRATSVHAHAIALAALARAGSALIQKHPRDWKGKLRKLQGIDWARSNARNWEGRAMIGGRLSKATTCVMLTGNAIKQHLGLSLTPEEQEAEAQLAGRS
jgi:DNA sulfur modification protein DndB